VARERLAFIPILVHEVEAAFLGISSWTRTMASTIELFPKMNVNTFYPQMSLRLKPMGLTVASFILREKIHDQNFSLTFESQSFSFY
jgi:hypothetical protein